MIDVTDRLEMVWEMVCSEDELLPVRNAAFSPTQNVRFDELILHNTSEVFPEVFLNRPPGGLRAINKRSICMKECIT